MIALRFAAMWERTPDVAFAWCVLVLVAVVDLAIVFGTGR